MTQDQLADRVTELEAQVAALISGRKTTLNTAGAYDVQKYPIPYHQGVEVTGGTTLYLSGLTPWNEAFQLTSKDFASQLDQALANLAAILAARKITVEQLVFLRVYIAKPNYYGDLEALASVAAKYFPAGFSCGITMLGVTGLAEPDQLVEIEAIALP